MGIDVLNFHILPQRKNKLVICFTKTGTRQVFFQPFLIWRKPNAHLTNVTRKSYYFYFTFSMPFKNKDIAFQGRPSVDLAGCSSCKNPSRAAFIHALLTHLSDQLFQCFFLLLDRLSSNRKCRDVLLPFTKKQPYTVYAKAPQHNLFSGL